MSRGGHSGGGHGGGGFMHSSHIGSGHPMPAGRSGSWAGHGSSSISHGFHGPRPFTGGNQHRSWANRPSGYWAGYGGYYWPWVQPTYSVYGGEEACTYHTVRGRISAVSMYSRYPDI